MIRDAVYRATSKRERAELHERAAGLFERTDSDVPLDETIGYHLEQAHRLRVELGPSDRVVGALAADAAERLGRAGLRAWKSGDAPAAANLLQRTILLRPPRDPRGLALACELGSALRTAGDAAHAERVLEEAAEVAGAIGERQIELRTRVELAYARLLSEPETGGQSLLELAEEAVPLLELAGDHRSLGRTLLLEGFVHGGARAQALQAVGVACFDLPRSDRGRALLRAHGGRVGDRALRGSPGVGGL